MKKSLSVLVRSLLVLSIAADLAVASMVAYHWQRGGSHGVMAWITHMHLAYGRSFDRPVTEAVISRGLTEFIAVVVALSILTLGIAFSDQALRRRWTRA